MLNNHMTDLNGGLQRNILYIDENWSKLPLWK